MIEVVQGDMAIAIRHLPPRYLKLGAYRLISRKSPEQMKEEKEAVKASEKQRRIDKYERTPGTVMSVLDTGETIFPVGLWPRIKQALDKNKEEYTVEDKRLDSVRPTPCYEALQDVQLRPGQDETLALIASNDCGIIKCPTGFGKSFVIKQLCRIYPTLNIVVTCSSAQVVGTLYEAIHEELPAEVGYLYQKGDTTNGKRIVVCTLKSLEKVNPENVQLLLVDECHAISCNRAGQIVSRFVFGRRFGFSASPIRNDGTGIVLEALMGPVIQDVSYAEAVDNNMVVPLQYCMLTCNSGPAFLRDVAGSDGKYHRKDMDETFRRRWDYWRNRGRNRIIADAVKSILIASPDVQILIMVDTLEHAIHLNMLLPGFLVAHYGATDMSTMEKNFPKDKYPNLDLSKYKATPKDLDRMRHAYEKGTLKRVISTTTWRQGVDFKQLTILFRAEARVSEVDSTQIPGRLARIVEGKKQAYIFDVFDMQDGWAKSRSEKREAFYEKQQWTATTLEAVLDDLRRENQAGAAGDIRSGSEGLSDGEDSDTSAGSCE